MPSADPPRGATGASGNRILAVGALALLVLGAFNLLRTVADGFTDDSGPPPQPPVSAAHALPALPAQFAQAASAPAPVFAAALPYAVPLRITAPRVGIDAALMRVGMTRGGALGVPPIADALMAAWFEDGPAPGQTGPAVIDAHVDSLDVRGHRAAFFALGALRPGDRVEITRSDHQVAEFTVDSVELVRKRDFPTQKVYGALPYAGLRLITCGGEFRHGQGYVGNVIAYAHLTGRHHT